MAIFIYKNDLFKIYQFCVEKNKSTTCDTNSPLSRPSFFLKYLVQKRHNSKNIAFRVMSLVLQLQLCHEEQVFKVWC